MATNCKPFSFNLDSAVAHSKNIIKIQAQYRGFHVRRLQKLEREALVKLKPIPGITTKVKAWIRGWDARKAVLESEQMFRKYIKAETEDLPEKDAQFVAEHMLAVLRGAYVKHTFQQYMCALSPSTKVGSIVKEYRTQVEADRYSLSQLSAEIVNLKRQREVMELELREERGKVAALEMGTSAIKARKARSEANHNLLRLVGGR